MSQTVRKYPAKPSVLNNAELVIDLAPRARHALGVARTVALRRALSDNLF